VTRTGLPQMLGGMFRNSKIAQRLGKQSLSVLDPGVRLSAHAMVLSCRVVGKCMGSRRANFLPHALKLLSKP
jgi:hypothetical protein